VLHKTTVTVYVENDPLSFPTFQYWVSVSFELNSFSKLDHRQAKNILFWKLGVNIDSAVFELPLVH
jgi:hypothetical protein